MKNFIFLFLSSVCLSIYLNAETPTKNYPKPLDFSNISVQGELLTRAQKNFDRLEEENYLPENVFPVKHDTSSIGWPGDKEGRTILCLVLEAQATHREPKYLAEMITKLPEKVNKMGYLGPVLKDSIMEQQLSGHGWFLRGLCEYYEWKQDPKVKEYIKNIIQNLALPTMGEHKKYPIDPQSRKINVGEIAGTIQDTLGKWMLSSDIGCDFIFMDGVIHAYKLFPSDELKQLVEEMLDRFFEMDLMAIKAQTHASLTAIRGALRYYEITRQPRLLEESEKRYKLYREMAMTEHYQNYNWFERPEWTEPCAIVDSYMAAVQLWQFTGKQEFLEDAHHIYYNGICHTQRFNGGFGCDNCPGPVNNNIEIRVNEAYWCCTMRGGEGLARAVQYNYFIDSDTLFIPFFNNSAAAFTINDRKIKLEQTSLYPFDGKVILKVIDAEPSDTITLKFIALSWTKNHRLLINNKPVEAGLNNGFLSYKTKLQKDDVIEFTFDMKSGVSEMMNKKHSRQGYIKLFYGPLILGYEGRNEITINKDTEIVKEDNNRFTIKGAQVTLSPVYHLLDSKVWKEKDYKKQILFKAN